MPRPRIGAPPCPANGLDLPNFPSGPVLEPTEYCTRFSEWFNGTSDCLQFPGQLIALVLVVWAASYGINEAGEEIAELIDEDFQQRKERVNEMLFELLYLIDIHGLLRKPSWDGVRVLLLTMPLTEGELNARSWLEAFDPQLVVFRGADTHGTPGMYDNLMRAVVSWYIYLPL